MDKSLNENENREFKVFQSRDRPRNHPVGKQSADRQSKRITHSIACCHEELL